MEQDIYLDVYFSFNFLMDFFVLFLTGIIIKNNKKIYRTIVSAIIGATYATIVMITEGMEIYQKSIGIFQKGIRPYKTVKNSFNLCCDSLCYGANCIWKIQCSYNDKKHDYYIHNYLCFKRCCQCILLGKQGR